MKSSDRKTFIGILLLGAVVATLYFSFVFFESPEHTFARYADEIIKTCSDASYVPSCYDAEIPKLMDRGISMEDAFHVTALIQAKDSRYWYCHVLGHELSAREAAKDLSRWDDVVARCPVGQCSNGCMHGAFQERFRDDLLPEEEIEKLIPKISNVCDSSDRRTFTHLERASCYHGLGHLMMYITQANIEQSVSLCDRVVREDDAVDFAHICYDGSFMQIFQPLEPEDFALVKDIAPETKEEAKAFCRQFSGEQYDSCHQESWPLFLDDIKGSGGTAAFCSEANQNDRQFCYNAIFNILLVQFQLNKEQMIPICNEQDEPYYSQCFANVASRLLEIDKGLIPESISYCTLAEERGVGDRCWQELLYYSWADFEKDSKDFKTLCSLMPSPWQERCFSGEGASVKIREL